jgi:formate dehydrogenase iron-sulfur subunit
VNRKAAATPVGFFTDTTLCIGCKACEVACKQWNQLPDDGLALSGFSYDNTVALGHATWRHVAFVERDGRWLMSSDVCKHCERAGCLEACPTGAIFRTEFGSVVVQADVCNGCGYCVVSCPFGVIDRRPGDGRAWKCTLCYDRLREGLEPACAKACPTRSISFGPLDELRAAAARRVAELHARGVTSARLYGAEPEEQPGTGGLHAFFLLTDRPEVYNLPPDPAAPGARLGRSWRAMAAAAAAMAAAALAAVAGGRR